MTISDNGTALACNPIPGWGAEQPDAECHRELTPRHWRAVLPCDVEGFNGRLRDALLNEILFHCRATAHTRSVLRARAEDVNTHRAHSALEFKTLRASAAHLITATGSHAAPFGVLTQRA